MLDINFDQVNKLLIDKYGRKSGIFSIDKPKNITSHDVVYAVRNKLGTKKVGHAGALDPFADGMLIILVGKFTKKTEQFINLDKTYIARVLIGLATDSGDIEGNIINSNDGISYKTYTEDEINSALDLFNNGYEQYVPIFSSVKVSGFKLRELARQSKKFEISEIDNTKVVVFYVDQEKINNKVKNKIQDDKLIIAIPHKHVNTNIKLINTGTIDSVDLPFEHDSKVKFQYVDIEINCSKGTYIRQLAIDIAEKLGNFGMLLELRRNSIGEINESQMIPLEKFNQMEFGSIR